MEPLSVALFQAALALTGVAALCYLLSLVRLRLGSRIMLTTTGAQVAVASDAPLPLDIAGRIATTAALAMLATSLIVRWQASGWAPWTNMWEYTVAFSGGILAFHLAFEHFQGDKRVSVVTLPTALTLMLIAQFFFPTKINPLVPALQNGDILALHVGVLILAYGALTTSFGAAVLLVIQAGKRNRFPSLPRAATLNTVAFRSVAAGFPLLTAGIALGAYWANSAWGRYWGWDPKETSILISWLIYGTYLHTHNLRKWSGTRSTVILIVGYASILFSYFAVNLYVAGLHSYAGV